MTLSVRTLRTKAKLSLVTDPAGEGGCGGPDRRTYVRECDIFASKQGRNGAGD